MNRWDRSWTLAASAVALVVATFSAAAHADEWLPPTTESYQSLDKMWRFTVTPRPVASGFKYFEDKVARRKNAGSPPTNKLTQAQGLLEHRQGGDWTVMWKKPLLNEVSPVTAIVSPSGQVVTFDNWHSMGYGKNTIVIYDSSGKSVRALGLDDVLPKDYVAALPRTVSSMWWGSNHRISDDGKQLILHVVIPTVEGPGGSDDSQVGHIDVAVDLATGTPARLASPEWNSALESAIRVNVAARQWEEQYQARFVAPLLAPKNDSEPDWHEYLREAFFRIDPDWKEGYPATTVLRLPQRSDYDQSVGFLRDALHDDPFSQEGALMIASPSQDNLVHVLSVITPTIHQGSLRTVRVYVAVDDAHSSAVAKLLAATEAKYIQLDPSKPIPQRKARLDAYRDSNGRKLHTSP